MKRIIFSIERFYYGIVGPIHDHQEGDEEGLLGEWDDRPGSGLMTIGAVAFVLAIIVALGSFWFRATYGMSESYRLFFYCLMVSLLVMATIFTAAACRWGKDG